MAGKFLLRSKDDATNPFAARLYDKGITATLPVVYVPNLQGTRTGFIGIMSQGSRFRGDLACGDVEAVFFAGVEIPRLDASGSPNWVHHKGTIAAAPVYKPIASVDTATNVLTVTGHGYANADPVAFWNRGDDAKVEPLARWVKYYAGDVTANTFKLYTDQALTTVVDLTSTANLSRTFVYKANAGIFDADQGRPYFFNNLNFTFSGLNYIEVLLPAGLSNGDDEPTKLKVKLRGKKVKEITFNVGTGEIEFTGSGVDSSNNALIAADIVINDMKRPMSRLGSSFINWRDRCDALINWVGGNEIPAQPILTAHPNGFGVVDVATNRFTRTAATDPLNFTAVAYTAQFTRRSGSHEVRYNGGDIAIHFTSSTDWATGVKLGAVVKNGKLYQNEFGIHKEITTISPSERIKIELVDGRFSIYKNRVPLPLPGTTTQPASLNSFYANIEIRTQNSYVDEILISPSGTSTIPRQIRRFTGGFVAVNAVPAIEAFEYQVQTSAVSWQDVGGRIEICSDHARTPIFTFVDDYTGATPSNCKIKIKKKDNDDLPNFYPSSVRERDDPYLARVYPPPVDRKERRAQTQDGRLISAPLKHYGVHTQSQVERLEESRARMTTDLDVGFDVSEAFLDSIKVAKGCFVYVVKPADGYTPEAPAKCIVHEERLRHAGDVETRAFDLQIIVDDWYSDTAHGAVAPPRSSTASNAFQPPPILNTLLLQEATNQLPDGTNVSSIEGTVIFEPRVGQTGRVYRKILRYGYSATADHTTNQFTTVGGVFANGTHVEVHAPSGTMPDGLDSDDVYAVQIVGGNVFKLIDTVTFAEIDFTSNGSNLQLFPVSAFVDTGLTVIPNPTNNMSNFEIAPAEAALYLIRVETRSAAGVSLPFDTQAAEYIQILGDLTPPDPPAWVRHIYDGVNIRFYWEPSPSGNTVGYVIKDENDRFLGQTDNQNLSFVSSSRASSVTVRVYAVNSTGVLSASYATVTFIRPPLLSWVNITGGGIDSSGDLEKTASTGWGNCGAVASHAFLTNLVPVRLSIALDSLTEYKAIGLARQKNVDHYDEIEYCLYFTNAGVLEAMYSGIVEATVDTGCEVGFVYSLKIDPVTNIVSIWRFRPTAGGETQEELLFEFATPSDFYPLYPAAALYSQGSKVRSSLELEGDLFPVNGVISPAANVVNAAYDDTTGNVTFSGSSAWNTSGFSLQDGLAAKQDGGIYFKPAQADKFIFVGMNTTDVDQNYFMLIGVALKDTGEIEIYHGGTPQTILSNPYAAGQEITLTRENRDIVVRQNRELVYSYPAPPSTLTDDAVIFDFAAYSTGGLNEIRVWQASESTVDPDTGNIAPAMATMQPAAFVGVNSADRIPPFYVTDPQEGQILRYINGLWRNDDEAAGGSTGITIGDPVTGGTNDRIFFQAAGLVAQSAGLTYTGALFSVTGTATKIANFKRASDGSEIGYIRDGGQGAGAGLGLVSNSHAEFSTPSGYALYANNVVLTGNHAATAVLDVNAASGQTAPLQRWKNAAGTVLSEIQASGIFYSEPLMDQTTKGFFIRPNANGNYYASTSFSAFVIDAQYSANFGLYGTPTVRLFQIINTTGQNAITVGTVGTLYVSNETHITQNLPVAERWVFKVRGDSSNGYSAANDSDTVVIEGYGTNAYGLYGGGKIRHFRIYDYDGSDHEIFSVAMNRCVGIGTKDPDSFLHIISGNAAVVAQKVQAASGQTADLLQIQNSSTTVLARIKANGNIEVPDEAFGVGWNGSLEVPTKNAVFDAVSGLSGGGGLTYTEVTGTTQSAAVNSGYITNNAAKVAVTLPATAAVGDAIAIVGKGAGGWRLAQNAGQTIHFGSIDTTAGATGYIESTVRYDTVLVRCITADTDFVVESVVGTLNIN